MNDKGKANNPDVVYLLIYYHIVYILHFPPKFPDPFSSQIKSLPKSKNGEPFQQIFFITFDHQPLPKEINIPKKSNI